MLEDYLNEGRKLDQSVERRIIARKCQKTVGYIAIGMNCAANIADILPPYRIGELLKIVITGAAQVGVVINANHALLNLRSTNEQ